MRLIKKEKEPKTLEDTRLEKMTDLSNVKRARNAFEHLDKEKIREHLCREQGYLCAYCMRRIDTKSTDKSGHVRMRISHLLPIDVDPSKALTWNNLLGSCDGKTRSSITTCDVAQGSKTLSVDPTKKASITTIKYERHLGRTGLFITSEDSSIVEDIETLGLNRGDFPSLRESAWKLFRDDFVDKNPNKYGKLEWKKHFPKWLKKHGDRLPEFLGVIEQKLI